ncbi:hypothetical protein [Sphingobium cloacae]|nr:hypothetical protein [Sphingobium cloacae]
MHMLLVIVDGIVLPGMFSLFGKLRGGDVIGNRIARWRKPDDAFPSLRGS